MTQNLVIPGRFGRRSLLRGGATLGLGAALAASGSRRGAAADELLVGWVLPITGALASSFQHLYVPGQMGVDEINAAGGILGHKIVLAKADDEGSPAKEPAVMRALIDKGVKYVVGPTASSQAVSSLEVSTPAKIIQGSYSSADEVGDGKRYPYHYQVNFGSIPQARKHVECLIALGMKKIGVLTEDSAAGAATRSAVLAELKAHDLELVSDQVFPVKVTDMTPFLRKMRSDGAQAIDCHISNNLDITQFLVGLSRMGWKPPVVGHTGLLYAGTKGAVPDDARYPEIYAATYKALTYTDKDPIDPKIMAFASRIFNAGIPDALIGVSATTPFYDFLYCVKQAAERARSLEVDAVKAQLDKFEGPGLYGTIRFTAENHQGYGADVVSMAVVNSVTDQVSADSKGLFRRRGPV